MVEFFDWYKPYTNLELSTPVNFMMPFIQLVKWDEKDMAAIIMRQDIWEKLKDAKDL